MNVTIAMDSGYVQKCMTEFRYKWVKNGWQTAKGNEVANKKLIKKALNLEREMEQNGRVRYKWIPREQNKKADAAANEELNDMNNDSNN